MTVCFRPATEGDRSFIVSAWSSSFRDAYAAGLIAMDDWATVMRPQIEKVLARPDCTTMIAHDSDEDPTVGLYGFISADVARSPALVYYCYTKQAYRRMGIARGLFAAIGVDPSRAFDYACRTIAVSELARKIPSSRWQPLAARYPKTTTPRKKNGEPYGR